MKNIKRINSILQIVQIILAFVLMFMIFKGIAIIRPLLTGG